ncbi:CD180 antigen-like [Diadema antillarum]|uniref:CD180 antigen-like n=1 Tax=Diadema antillarum TaxID=105358 RepID=UPI003A8A6BE9
MPTEDPSKHCIIILESRQVYCRRIGLSSVPSHLPGNTELLDLSFNRITTLHNTSFFIYKQLKVLDIAYNDIGFIESGTFLGLSHLRVLDLSKNPRLPVLQRGMFASNDLTSIQLNHTNLARVSDDLFRAMATTSRLGLTSNVMTNVNWTDCHDVAFLFVILSNNKFSELSEKSFVMQCSVDYLDLSLNPIRLVSPTTISSLNVRSLQMDAIALPEKELYHLFKGVRSSSTITSLYIRDIGVTSLRPGLMGALQGKYLRNLDVAMNQLTQLIPRAFEHLTGVSELNFNHNYLTAIDPSHFSGMSSLRVLSLQRNNISVINTNRKLLINFNPVRECGPQFVLYLSVVVSAFCTTLAVILIYYHRWKIGYVLFLCKIHFIGYREIVARQQRAESQYDMYIITHEEDEEWTDEIFRRGLEENLPEYDRLAIGDEALVLGMYYLDSVSHLVERSFKVVFLISAHSLRNHMFLLKFRLALDHVNEVQIEKIVLVFLEEIPDAELPFLVRLFLSDNRAYLMWPRDPEGQDYFWEKLAKYMTVNRNCNPLVPP